MLLDGFPALAALVERRIEEAIERGELSGLPGEGRPLEFDDDNFVPQELRVANRILKNSGYLSPDAAELMQINRLIAAVRREDDEHGEVRLRALLIKLEAAGRTVTATRAWADYENALLERVSAGGRHAGSKQGR